MSPSQLIEYFLGVIHFLYSDYERQKNAGIEKRSFKRNPNKSIFTFIQVQVTNSGYRKEINRKYK